MKSNENYYKNRSLSIHIGNKSLSIEKSKTKSDKSKILSSKTTAGNAIENSRNKNASFIANQVKEVIQRSTVYKDKENDSKQANDEAVKTHSLEQSNTNTVGYQSNANSYIGELHKALVKECNYYLTDFNSLNAKLNSETLSNIFFHTANAIKDKKIFSMYGYYPVVAEELKKRGWIEKRDPEYKPLDYEYLSTTLSIPNNRRMFTVDSPPSMTWTMTIVGENTEKAHAIWSMLKKVTPNYLFTTKKKSVDWNNVSVTTASQFAHLTICTKGGLAGTVRAISNRANVKFPRAYQISDPRTLQNFTKDFRLTAVVSFLKTILRTKNNQKRIFNESGTIPYEMIDFVEQRCWEFINTYKHENEKDLLWFTTELESGWKKFMIWYYEFTEEMATIRLSNQFQINDIYERFDGLARKIESFCPQYYIDGDTNLWIVKPPYSCSGLGIRLERHYDSILKILTDGPNKQHKTHVVQKYIEKPLLIFDVKVDLRQYFLVTNAQPTKIWLYKEGYVRFCSKKFSVNDLSDAVHLSNVRVQSDYRKYRTSGVPEECMWDFAEFKRYLTSIGDGDKWHGTIYPAIRETLLTVLLEVPFRRDPQGGSGSAFSFQLLGADFILTENYEPWLIEVNGNPGLNPTTSVISRIATSLLRDTVKVTVDFPLNSNADTGLFENIYTHASVKDCKAKRVNTKEYYYWKPPPKNMRQSNKQSLRGVGKNKK